MNSSPFKPATAWLPIAMSGAALVTVLLHLAVFGTARQPDEPVTVHVWQLLIVGEIPFLIVYAIRWLSQTPGAALKVLGTQVAAAVAAVAPVYLLGGL